MKDKRQTESKREKAVQQELERSLGYNTLRCPLRNKLEGVPTLSRAGVDKLQPQAKSSSLLSS